MSEEEKTRNLIEQPQLTETIQDCMATSFFHEGQWPKKKWWEDFEVPALNQLIEEAFARNPSIQSMCQRIELAKQRAIQAQSKLYPLVYFDADGTWEFVSKQGLQEAYNPEFPRHAHIIDLTLTFSYEFDFWDKYRNLFRAALGQERAAQAELAQGELITAVSLAKTYFALQTNLTKQKIYQQLLEVRQKLALLRQLLLRESLEDVRCVLLADEQVEEAQQWLYSIEEEIEVNRHLINILAGRGPDEKVEIDNASIGLPKKLTIPETVSIDLLSRRPDLMAQIWRLEAIAHEVGAARADFFPNINLSAIMGLSSTIYNLLFNHSSYEQSLTPTMSLPVYTAGGIQANLDAKRAEYQTAVFMYNEMILKSAEEVVDALVFARTVYAKKEQQELIVQQVARRLELAQYRLNNGLDNALQTLEQKEALLQKELEDLNLTYGQYAAAIAMVRALGGGYQSL